MAMMIDSKTLTYNIKVTRYIKAYENKDDNTEARIWHKELKERGAGAHFSLGCFSFLRGGGTGASAPAAAVSFFTTFLTIFFLGGSAGAGAESGDAVAPTDDSILAAVDVLSLVLTPIWASDTGGVGTSGS